MGSLNEEAEDWIDRRIDDSLNNLPSGWKEDVPPYVGGIESKEQYERYYIEYTEIRRVREKYDSEFGKERLESQLESLSLSLTSGGLEGEEGQEEVEEWSGPICPGLEEEYRKDVMHLEHEDIHWSMCVDENCEAHGTARKEAGGEVMKSSCGKQRWQECRERSCAWHLYSKRVHRDFPGSSDAWKETWETARDKDGDTKWCHLVDFFACIFPNCGKHVDWKEEAGLLG